MSDILKHDVDPQETQEWLEALTAVLEQEGPERAHYLLEQLIDKARRSGAHLPHKPTTAYLNTIPPGQEPQMPGNLELERKLRGEIPATPGLSLGNNGDSEPHFTSNCGEENFHGYVNKIKNYILAGDTMQVVVSQRMSIDFAGEPINLYRALRNLNPSPYMYFMDLGDHHVVGSSPEILARLEDGEVTVRPIAGTRRRGRSRLLAAALVSAILRENRLLDATLRRSNSPARRPRHALPCPLQGTGAAGFDARPHPHLHALGPAHRHLDHEGPVRDDPDRAGRGGSGRRVVDLGGVPDDHRPHRRYRRPHFHGDSISGTCEFSPLSVDRSKQQR